MTKRENVLMTGWFFTLLALVLVVVQLIQSRANEKQLARDNESMQQLILNARPRK